MLQRTNLGVRPLASNSSSISPPASAERCKGRDGGAELVGRSPVQHDLVGPGIDVAGQVLRAIGGAAERCALPYPPPGQQAARLDEDVPSLQGAAGRLREGP